MDSFTAKEFKAARQRLGMGADRLSARVGVSANTIRQAERPMQALSPQILQRYTARLKTLLDELDKGE